MGNIGLDMREMPYGRRRSPLNILSGEEIEALKEDIAAIEADESVFVFNDDRFSGTAYISLLDKIAVRGNVFPDMDSIHPRDLLSPRAVLAHEYYGHRPYRDTKMRVGDWRDEFRASYMAAKSAPGLSGEDKRLLVLDAIERAKEAGVSITYNDFMRGVLYESAQ